MVLKLDPAEQSPWGRGGCLLKETAAPPPRRRIQLSEMGPRVCFSNYFPGSWTKDHTFEKPGSTVQGCVVLVVKSHLTLCDPMNCSRLGYSVHGILQARVLEWVATPFSRAFSQRRDQTQVSSIAGRFFTV